MHHNFKDKFYEPVCWNFNSRESFIAILHFQETIGLLIVALNSSHSQKSVILAFTFAVNTSLSSMENGVNLTNSNVFVMLNM